MNIEENSIFIADSHYNFQREELFELLLKIDESEIECSQLFLVGDIFDFLSNEIEYFKNINNSIIELIKSISRKKKVVYIEGNHDFNLQNIFPTLKVVSREEQPLRLKLHEKTVEISHGDIFVGDSYDIFCKVIRNSIFLHFLNLIDISNWLSKLVEFRLASKKICHEIEDFKSVIEKKIDNYSADIVIEGHYHEGKSYLFGKTKYINIPSLACSNQYLIYKQSEFYREDI